MPFSPFLVGLKIDSDYIYQEETPVGTEENPKISETMYFGGHPGQISHTEHTEKNFGGSINNVHILAPRWTCAAT